MYEFFFEKHKKKETDYFKNYINLKFWKQFKSSNHKLCSSSAHKNSQSGAK